MLYWVHLLLYNKLSPNLAAQNNKHLLFHTVFEGPKHTLAVGSGSGSLTRFQTGYQTGLPSSED